MFKYGRADESNARTGDMSLAKPAAVTGSGEIYRLSVSDTKGSTKSNVDQAILRENFGIVGDAHAGSERQVSLLPFEAFDLIRGQLPDISPGDFAENITTRGIDLSSVSIGDCLYIGENVRVVITHIGKICHNDCLIKQAVGDCIMPRLGIFASVAEGGSIRVGDRISLKRARSNSITPAN
jgi:cyclic pyranopterin phosphate synthase